METIGKIFTSIILIVLSTLMSGYVLSKLWLWLIVPTFNIHAITVPQALGLSTVVHFLLLGVTMNMKAEENKNETFLGMLVTKFFVVLVTNSLSLLMGYIYSLFI